MTYTYDDLLGMCANAEEQKELRKNSLETILLKTGKAPKFISLLNYDSLKQYLTEIAESLRTHVAINMMVYGNAVIITEQKSVEELQDSYIKEHEHLLEPKKSVAFDFELHPYQQRVLDWLRSLPDNPTASISTAYSISLSGYTESSWYDAKEVIDGRGHLPVAQNAKFGKRERRKPQIPVKEVQIVNSNIKRRKRK